MNIGEAAARSGVSPKMIRHYEAIGLIRPERRPNNYRAYSDKTVSVLRFIRHARELNLPLAEVRKLLALWEDQRMSPERVRSSALGQFEALEQKAASMRAMAKALRDLADTIEAETKPEVPRFEAA